MRIATGVVQGMAFAVERPVVPVSTLAALAQGAWRELGEGRVLASLDARMGEVYWGAYVQNGKVMALQGDECVVAPVDAPQAEGDNWFGSGSGWQTYHRELSAAMGDRLRGWEDERFPQARDIATLAAGDYDAGRAVRAEQALPIYLRDNVAKKSAQ